MESELVEMEIDAARALTEFASAARNERGRWGATGSRRRRRRTGVGGSSFDLNLEANTEEEQNHLQYDENAVEGRPEQFVHVVHKEEEHNHLDSNDEDGREGRTTQQISVKQEETWQSTPSCSSSWLSSTPGRTKLELTETEKEEKKLRRILANRESARQTIRRRQVLCEELKTKAAALSLDNEKMKKEKELALREYFLLYEANQKLNEKMVERLKAERSTQLELGTNGSTENPLVMHQRSPFILFASPPTIGPLNHLNTHQTCKSYEQGNNRIATCPTSPFYTAPYMWFNPLIPQQSVSSSVNTCASSGTGGDTLYKELGSSRAMLFDEKTTSAQSRTGEQMRLAGIMFDNEKNSHCKMHKYRSSAEGHQSSTHTTSYLSNVKPELESDPLLRIDPESQDCRQMQTYKVVVASEARKRRRRRELTKLKKRPWS